jgi:CheY-like chemotaxis protein
MANRSILLIEHETSLREVLGACLRDLGGWKVTFSKSIKEGIDLCEQQKPHVILVDTSTPETDALLFIEQLKAQSHTHSIPILLVSSRAKWFSTDQLQQMGFAGAIAKPFDPATLPTDIATLMQWQDFDP